MTNHRWLGLALTASAAAACGDDEPTHTVASGVYQISTSAISGDCQLDYTLRPGALVVGSVMPGAVVASAVSIAVQVCGHAAADPSCGGAGGLGDAFDFAMARDGNQLVGGQPIWGVPGCGMPDYEARLQAVGQVTGKNELSLTWTATITATDPNWMCSGYRPCTSTIEQRMATATPP